MSTLRTPAGDVSDALLETAMMWRQRMDAPEWGVAADAELEAWLQADERHAEAFDRTGALWDFFDQHAAAPEMIAARRALLGRAQKVVRRRVAGAGGRFVPMPSRRMAAVLAGVAVLAAAGAYPLVQRGEVYATDRGERRVVTLDDGSRLSLDAETRVSVRLTRDARRLRLLRGQARFDVAKDATRPFSVRARNATVVATGTAFNIDMLDPRVKVTLIEGRVIVLESPPPSLIPGREPSHARKKAVELRPGEQLVAPENARPQVVAAVDLDEATAWQRGKLMFDQEPLADAVAKVNRYAARRITVEGAAGAVPVSGVFEAGDTSGFIEAITGFLPIAVVEGADGVTLRPVETGG